MNNKCSTVIYNAVVPMTHPSIAGHFPGEPVVPGVVILDVVQDKIEAWIGLNNPRSLPSVKFVTPLLPDELFSIHLEHSESGKIIFTCYREESVIAQGKIIFRLESST